MRRFPVPVSRTVVGLAILGLLFFVAGLVLAAAMHNEYVGVALVVLGGFLLILPLTRPSVDE